MKSKLAKNLSANTLQLVINQLAGVVIFYLLSTKLDKNNFGRLNLVLAILLAVFNILSMGIDQLVIKKIASGQNIRHTLSIYLFHVLVTGLIFYAVLLAGAFLLPSQTAVCSLLLLLGIGKFMQFLSTPFKQVTSGLERFNLLAYMLVASNLVRCLGLVVFALLGTISLPIVVTVFVAGDGCEFMLTVYLFRRYIKETPTLRLDKIAYQELLREALPQSGVVVITSALARFDWIFIGFTLSAIKLAEYSFAYKVFEIATLPMLAIAPLLIPRFTKFFAQDGNDTSGFSFLIRVEIIIALLVALIINVAWAPVIDLVTAGKYGAVNSGIIFLLSLCMPLLYINNFLWTIFFAKGQLKLILHSFIVTLAINVIGDIVLIPLYKNEGAAFAFLLSCLAQTIFYIRKNEVSSLNKLWHSLTICTTCALLAGFAAKTLVLNSFMAIVASVIIYFVLLIICAQLKLKDKKQLRLLFS